MLIKLVKNKLHMVLSQSDAVVLGCLIFRG